ETVAGSRPKCWASCFRVTRPLGAGGFLPISVFPGFDQAALVLRRGVKALRFSAPPRWKTIRPRSGPGVDRSAVQACALTARPLERLMTVYCPSYSTVRREEELGPHHSRVVIELG